MYVAHTSHSEVTPRQGPERLSIGPQYLLHVGPQLARESGAGHSLLRRLVKRRVRSKTVLDVLNTWLDNHRHSLFFAAELNRRPVRRF